MMGFGGERNKFVVIYGSNNLGKSTQFDLLERTYQEIGRPYTRIKYPIYGSPTGDLINKCLRVEGWNDFMTEEGLQFMFAMNRRLYEPTLKDLLMYGDVLAEDYLGTGLAWGLTRDVSRDKLNDFNADLLEPDVSILLDGERFSGGIERQHRNEGAGDEVWNKSREVHRLLARELGWQVVNANQEKEKVHEDILRLIFV